MRQRCKCQNVCDKVAGDKVICKKDMRKNIFQIPYLPRATKVDLIKSHAYHAKDRSVTGD